MSDGFTVTFGTVHPVRGPGSGVTSRAIHNISGPAVYFSTEADFEPTEGTEIAPGESASIDRQIWIRTPDRFIDTKILVIEEES